MLEGSRHLCLLPNLYGMHQCIRGTGGGKEVASSQLHKFRGQLGSMPNGSSLEWLPTGNLAGFSSCMCGKGCSCAISINCV